MSSSGYTVEVINLSPNATEKDVYDFFAFSGAIEHVEIFRSGDYACTAYVTFKEPHSLETATLLSGATIVDQHVCISRWGQNEDEFDLWNRPSWKLEEDANSSASNGSNFLPSTREAVDMAQEVVKAMLSKGFMLGKDALIKAKEFDQSHQVSQNAAAKAAELSKRIGLTEKVNAIKSVDERYRVSETTRRTTAAAANSVINSSYFSAGAFWVSDALSRAAKIAGDLGNHGMKK